MADPGILLSGAMAGLTILTSAVTTTFFVTRMLDKRDMTLVKLMTDHELMDTQRFSDVRGAIGTAGDTVRREFGETTSALRQHMHEAEMWGRDNFLRKESFQTVTNEIKQMIGRLDVKIDDGQRHAKA